MAKIDLDGKTRELKYTYGSIRAMEREAGGVGIGKLVSGDRVGFDTMCLFVWAGLRHENKRLTTEQVENWLDRYIRDGGTFQALGILVNASLVESGVLGKIEDTAEDAVQGNG
jgi:hypothetical protein